MTLTNEQVIERITDIIDIETYLRKNSDGHYYGEIYADHHDELSKQSIKKIFKSNHPREEFYEMVSGVFLDADGEYYNDILKILENHFDDEHDEACYDEWEDFIRDWVYENVHFDYPYKHFLNQDIQINIIVDTGDANYDYTLNNLFNWYADRSEDREISEKSSLIWLMKQQGYTFAQIVDFIENENFHGSKLLKSIYQESVNCSTSMGALVFLVNMSLEEALKLNETVGQTNAVYTGKHEEEDKRQGNIIISKDTQCGLFDAWNGAGGVLEIELEKDVMLPLKYVDSSLPDGCRGLYSVMDTYGICSSLWTGECVKIMEAA